jgi:quinoprotein glucose dehydrogenase
MSPRMLLLSASALVLIGAGMAYYLPQISGIAPGKTAIAAQQGPAQPKPSTANGEWPHYAADTRGSRYSPLDQINASNFNQLQVAWRLKTDMFGPYPEWKLEGTPLMIKGVLYTTAGTRRSVIAIDAKSGEVIWTHSLREGQRAAVSPRQLSGHGVAYWTDGRGDERILYVTTGYRLVALDAKTGQLIEGFGEDGIVDLKLGVVRSVDEQIDLNEGEIGLHSTPLVARDYVIVGGAMREGATIETHNNTKGLVRAFDVRTGRMVWRFDTIPRPGQPGNETWENNSWAENGNVGVWTQIAADEELGLVYLPVETPSSDYYGGHRPGDNLYAESLVAVDLNTGERKWHFQFTHHPIWNFDMSSMPILADITVDGRDIKAVAVPSKQGWLYVFDRVTGQPVWPIEERPVPQSDVPGEKTAATQPHPPEALRYNRNVLKLPDDLIDFTPQLRAEALEVVKKYRYEPSPFTPGSVAKAGERLGSIVPGTATNWPGGGYDPELKIVYAPTGNVPAVRALRTPPAEFSDIRYMAGVEETEFREVFGPGDCCAADNPLTAQRAREAKMNAPPPPPVGGVVNLGVQGLPIVKPPYGMVSAIDLNAGNVKWQTPHGDTPDNIRNHPALRNLNVPKTGQPGASGVGLLVTKTLVIIGDPQSTTTPSRPRGAVLHAYDKVTGQQVGEIPLPSQQSASPMTYMVDGKQYIVLAVSDPRYSGEYMAFTLPE